MSFFNVFCFIEIILIYDINNVRLNRGLFLYLVGISFLEQNYSVVTFSWKVGIFRGLVSTALCTCDILIINRQ